jgi:hypothetical protein
MRIDSIKNTNPNTDTYKPISFKSTTKNEAALSIQNPDNTKFEDSFEKSTEADAVQNPNMLTAFLGKGKKAWDTFIQAGQNIPADWNPYLSY